METNKGTNITQYIAELKISIICVLTSTVNGRTEENTFLLFNINLNRTYNNISL